MKKMENLVSNLIFIKENYVTDTIPTIWSQSGEILETTFLNKSFETLILRKIAV